MTDLDSTVKTLINQAVDAELGGRRSAPPLDFAAGTHAPAAAGPVARWRLPLLAASVASLLTVGATVAITGSRHHDAARPSSTAAAPIIVLPTHDRTGSDRTPAVEYPEATDVPGVSVGPVPAKYATLAGGAIVALANPVPFRPSPDGSYPVKAQWVSVAGDTPTTVVSFTVSNVSSANCPPPFLGHAGHSYVLTCSVIRLPGHDAKAFLKLAGGMGFSSGSWAVKFR